MDHRDATHRPDVDAAQNFRPYLTGDGAGVARQCDEEGFPEAAGRDVDTRLEVIVPRCRDRDGPCDGLEWACRYRRTARKMADSNEVGLAGVGKGDVGVDQRAGIVLDADVECDCRCLEDDIADRGRHGGGRAECKRCRFEGGGLIAGQPETEVVGVFGR